MSKRDPTEEALNALSELRRNPSSPQFKRQLVSYLGHRSNLVIAKAAKTSGELRITELIPDLAAAFQRLMANPAKLDKGCAAATAIAGALYAMDYDSAEVYLKGVRHVQMEGSYGPPVDAAAQLRADSALGLIRTRHPDAVFEVVRLLADKETRVRAAAARALGSLVDETGELLLLLKALTGDSESDVLAECFSGMLGSGAERSLAFVAAQLDHKDEASAEAAALSLGGSRLPGAIEALREKWDRTVHGPMRRVLLLALATARQDSALDFLLSIVAKGEPPIAAEVIQALGTYRNEERARKALEETVEKRADRQLRDAFQAEFRG